MNRRYAHRRIPGSRESSNYWVTKVFSCSLFRRFSVITFVNSSDFDNVRRNFYWTGWILCYIMFEEEKVITVITSVLKLVKEIRHFREKT